VTSPIERWDSLVDHAYISRAVARLRAELDQIGTENRLYFMKKKHKKGEVLDRQLRVDRVREIVIELERLMTRKIA
jgi:hypothetical protein